jgi:excisionase family DNA binding protein
MNTSDSGSQQDPWLTLGEIAAELRVNPATVRLWVSKGQLAASRAGVRKWIVRRSEVDRMLAAANASAETNVPGPPADELSASQRREPEVLADEDHGLGEPLPPVGSESAWQLVERAERTIAVAFKASASAPPSAGYPHRLRAIADGFEHLASTLLHAGRTTTTTWAGSDRWGPDWLPYELRPGGNRPVRDRLWEQFDAAFEALTQAMAGTDIVAVGEALRQAADELLAVADQLAGDDAERTHSTLG